MYREKEEMEGEHETRQGERERTRREGGRIWN